MKTGGITLCEFQARSFNARGSDDYLNAFAACLDQMFQSGWEVMEANRDSVRGGWWKLWLYKE